MRFLTPLLAGLVLAAPAGAAAARPPVGLAIANRPGVTQLSVTASPGSLVSGAVAVSSSAAAPVAVTLAPASALTAPRTGIRFVASGKLSGLGGWLHLSQTQVVLTAGAKKEVGFSLTVPPKAKPGQYVGGIVTVTPRLSVTLVVNVPGKTVTSFTVASAAALTPRLVTIHVANEGNVVRHPSGALTIANARGKTVATKAFRMGDFLPQTAIDYPLPLSHRLAVGTYTATVRLTYAGANGAPQTVTAAPRLVVSPAPVVTTPKPPPPTTTQPVPQAASRHSIHWAVPTAAIAALLLLLGLLVAHRRRQAAHARTAHTGAHYWRVDWEQRDADRSGALRHLYRCRDCGVEVMARDIRDASLSCR